MYNINNKYNKNNETDEYKKTKFIYIELSRKLFDNAIRRDEYFIQL